mmetsp:Transcript_19040/g.62038  ORF Transcript_19040/g.62038 Transcript_19040/m.62038 type:complete len:287 (-) Transcript_19040:800-1660(-)
MTALEWSDESVKRFKGSVVADTFTNTEALLLKNGQRACNGLPAPTKQLTRTSRATWADDSFTEKSSRATARATSKRSATLHADASCARTAAATAAPPPSQVIRVARPAQRHAVRAAPCRRTSPKLPSRTSCPSRPAASAQAACGVGGAWGSLLESLSRSRLMSLRTPAAVSFADGSNAAQQHVNAAGSDARVRTKAHKPMKPGSHSADVCAADVALVSPTSASESQTPRYSKDDAAENAAAATAGASATAACAAGTAEESWAWRPRVSWARYALKLSRASSQNRHR